MAQFPVNTEANDLVNTTIFRIRWIHGSLPRSSKRDPPPQLWRFNSSTMILRQSRDISFEAPFIYLFLGREKALLIDTGATQDRGKFPLRDYVEEELERWLNSNPCRDYSLIVAHTHSHGDHVAGDLQFEGRLGTVVVGKQVGQVLSFFGISGMSGNVGQVDLGGRIIEVIRIPGHHPASVAFYDSQTGFLVTGDTVCPGRLYARDYPAFVDSLNRLVEFAKSRKLSYVLGAHVEMTDIPRKEYPIGARYQLMSTGSR